jgi:hypothetical protein
MATRHALRLSIKTQVYVAQTKLIHPGLLTTRTTKGQGNSALYASVRSCAIRGEPRSLEGKNLVRSQLLLIESSLLTLECFDLILNCDLFRHNASNLGATFIPSLQHILVGITRGGLLLRELETSVLFTDGRGHDIAHA